MTSPRRSFITRAGRLALALSAVAGFGLAQAQTPTKILVGFPAGGGSDAVARILAERLQAELGDNVLVDNKPGAGGQLAAHALKVAPADGHTVFLSHDHSVSILPLTMKNPGFDPAKDFVPVAGFATFVNAVALSGGTPAADLKGWIAAVKAAGQSFAPAARNPSRSDCTPVPRAPTASCNQPFCTAMPSPVGTGQRVYQRVSSAWLMKLSPSGFS